MGPAANPLVIATVARRGPGWGVSAGPFADSSRIQAVPELNAAPLATPATSRPAYSHPNPPTASSPLATSEAISAASRTRRRP
jgi:hypothetical protein